MNMWLVDGLAALIVFDPHAFLLMFYPCAYLRQGHPQGGNMIEDRSRAHRFCFDRLEVMARESQ